MNKYAHEIASIRAAVDALTDVNRGIERSCASIAESRDAGSAERLGSLLDDYQSNSDRLVSAVVSLLEKVAEEVDVPAVEERTAAGHGYRIVKTSSAKSDGEKSGGDERCIGRQGRRVGAARGEQAAG